MSSFSSSLLVLQNTADNSNSNWTLTMAVEIQFYIQFVKRNSHCQAVLIGRQRRTGVTLVRQMQTNADTIVVSDGNVTSMKAIAGVSNANTASMSANTNKHNLPSTRVKSTDCNVSSLRCLPWGCSQCCADNPETTWGYIQLISEFSRGEGINSGRQANEMARGSGCTNRLPGKTVAKDDRSWRCCILVAMKATKLSDTLCLFVQLFKVDAAWARSIEEGTDHLSGLCRSAHFAATIRSQREKGAATMKVASSKVR